MMKHLGLILAAAFGAIAGGNTHYMHRRSSFKVNRPSLEAQKIAIERAEQKRQRRRERNLRHVESNGYGTAASVRLCDNCFKSFDFTAHTNCPYCGTPA